MRDIINVLVIEFKLRFQQDL